jgi:CheY-like chemotaxis protein
MDGEQTAALIRNSPEIKDTRIIILTSLGSRGDISRQREAGCDGYLVKPVKQSLLLDTMITVLSRAGSAGYMDMPTVTQTAMPAATLRDVRILLAEDNEVNQKVTSSILRKAGYDVEIVGNGRLAVEAVERGGCDLVLMDVQMPGMDGFEATRKIRELEGEKCHSIIIALTAHALKGDRDRCIEIGMDDYITKPINPADMFSVIDKWLPMRGKRSTQRARGKDIASKEQGEEAGGKGYPVDMESAMVRFDNDAVFFREMLVKFLEIVPEQVDRLSEAVHQMDFDKIHIYAHGIKGSASNLSAVRVMSIARSIEDKGSGKDITNVLQHTKDLKSEIQRLAAFVQKLPEQGV